MQVLTWNLFHGRAVPDLRCGLLDEFAGALAAWPWDFALLQEVPPWWPPQIARAAGARQRTVRTSRNAFLPVRRVIAERRPDLIKSNGGGANSILARTDICEHRVHRLRRWPERRVLHAVRTPNGLWAANLHASAHNTRRAVEDAALAARVVRAWAAGAPVVLGGDFNLSEPELCGWRPAASHGVDHIAFRGLGVRAEAELLDAGGLSDHSPLMATLPTIS